jgi:hypothetical protein
MKGQKLVAEFETLANIVRKKIPHVTTSARWGRWSRYDAIRFGATIRRLNGSLVAL